MSAQTIKTAAGEELVVLARADYDALIARLEELEEDLADIASFDAAMAERDDKPARAINGDVLTGALIRARRKELGMTQAALADAIGVQQGFVSDLESGRRNGSFLTLGKVADALSMSAVEKAALTA